jgi:hypothetical protein
MRLGGAVRRMAGTMNPRLRMISIAALALVALGVGAAAALGDGEGLTDRLNVTRLFNSANCAITGNDCKTPASPSGTPTTPSSPSPMRPLPPRGKTDVGVFEFTVSGKQTTSWTLDETQPGPNCSTHVTGSGEQTITLKSIEPGWAEFTADKTQLLVNANPPATVLATVKRTGTVKSTTDCPPVADGGAKPTKPDCGKPISAKIEVGLLTSELDTRGTPVGVLRTADYKTLPAPDYKNCPFYGMKDDPFKGFGLKFATDHVTQVQLLRALAGCKKRDGCKAKALTLRSRDNTTRIDPLPGGRAETTIDWTVVMTPTTREVSR